MTAKWIPPGQDAAEAFAVREAVFVQEQGFSRESEFDKIDGTTAHHLVLLDDAGAPIACGRIFADPEREYTWQFGRIAVMQDHRKSGMGAVLLGEMELRARELGAEVAELGAQCQARGFYEKLGYTAYGDQYMDEHVPHIHMRKAL